MRELTAYALWRHYGQGLGLRVPVLVQVLEDANLITNKLTYKGVVCLLKINLTKTLVADTVKSWQKRSFLSRWLYSRKAVKRLVHNVL